MRLSGAGSRSLHFVLAAVFAGIPWTAAGQQTGEPTVAVFGVVTERGTQNPIEAATVRLVPDGDSEPLVKLTDSFGRFAIPDVPAGRYRLLVERLGYEPVEEAVELLADSDVRVELVVEAVEMEPLLVVTDRTLRPDIPGWDRRRRQDLGTFITREEIERPGIILTTDVLRRVPSVQVVPKRNGHGNDIFIRGCRPLLYVDGVPISRTRGAFALDDLYGPDGVEAIEVYTSATIPPDFGFGSNSCGAVIVWTRRVQSEAGQQSSWKWFGIAAGVFGALLLLTR